MNDRKTLRVRLSKKHWKLLLKLIGFDARPEFWKNFPRESIARSKDAKGKFQGGVGEALEKFLEGKAPSPPTPEPPATFKIEDDKLDHRWDVPEKPVLPRSPKGRAHSWLCTEKRFFVNLKYCQKVCDRYILCEQVKQERHRG